MMNHMTNHDKMGGDSMDHHHSPAEGETETPPPPTFGGHNQMVVGEKTIYLSHLPMFMFDPERHEHNFQVILEVTFNEPHNAQTNYVRDRQRNPNERMYTMQPEPFEMIELDPQHPTRHTLTGTIFRGHLERGGQEIIFGANAKVVNVVYFHEFEKNAEPLAQLEYLLFGKGSELFLAHVIIRPPDFDQILAVQLSGHSFTDDELSKGIRITIPDRANTPHTRLKTGEHATGHAQLTGAEQPLQLQLDAGTEFYFEEGELRDPEAMTFKPTREEKAAGF